MTEPKDVRLTPEILSKIKGCTAFDVEAVFPYVPKDFRENNIPKAFWPVFTLKSKDGLESAEVEDTAGYFEYKNGSSLFHPASGSRRVSTLEHGIVKIKNLPIERHGSISTLSYDSEALEVQIGTSTPIKLSDAREIVRYLKPALQVELQNAINERSTLTEEEKQGLEF